MGRVMSVQPGSCLERLTGGKRKRQSGKNPRLPYILRSEEASSFDDLFGSFNIAILTEVHHGGPTSCNDATRP